MAFSKKRKHSFDGGGLIIFLDVQDALKSERALKKAGYAIRLVAPPPQLRKGCDLALEINLVEQPSIERTLDEEDCLYVSIVPLKADASPLLQIVKVTDFGNWVMVKSGNMKLSFEKESGLIVNTSGGGCPDIPHLHAELIGKKLTEAPRPKDIGFTLCAMMLDKALEEGLALCQGSQR